MSTDTLCNDHYMSIRIDPKSDDVKPHRLDAEPCSWTSTPEDTDLATSLGWQYRFCTKDTSSCTSGNSRPKCIVM